MRGHACSHIEKAAKADPAFANTRTDHRHPFAGVFGSPEGRVIAVVGGENRQIARAQLRQKRPRPPHRTIHPPAPNRPRWSNRSASFLPFHSRPPPCIENISPIFPIAWVARPAPETQSSKVRSEEHTSELQSQFPLVCRLLLSNKP